MDDLPILAYFEYEHLPVHLQEISAPFGRLAEQIGRRPTKGAGAAAERSTALRKLLEAKDAAVRAAL